MFKNQHLWRLRPMLLNEKTLCSKACRRTRSGMGRFLNVNQIRDKIINVGNVTYKFVIAFLCVEETKIDQSFPVPQFKIDGYQYQPFPRDRSSEDGGETVYIRECLTAKRLTKLETKTVAFTYRSPKLNKNEFFRKTSVSVSKIINKYENLTC